MVDREKAKNRMDKFEGATFYDCVESERLTHDSPGKAIADVFDGLATPGESVKDCIRAHTPVTVTAYERQTIPQSWIEDQLERFVQGLDEEAAEEYGDPEGFRLVFDKDAETAIARALLPALTVQVQEHANVRSCEAVAIKVYDAAAIERVLRETCPEWFEGL